MKKIICIMLILTFSNLVIARKYYTSDDYYKGKIDGSKYAEENYSGGGWVPPGFIGGFTLSLIGAGLALGASQKFSLGLTDQAKLDISQKEEDYQAGFEDGYKEKVKSKRLVPVIIGSLVGIVLAIGLFYGLEEAGDDEDDD